jgi:hypothetical protein
MFKGVFIGGVLAIAIVLSNDFYDAAVERAEVRQQKLDSLVVGKTYYIRYSGVDAVKTMVLSAKFGDTLVFGSRIYEVDDVIGEVSVVERL